MIRKSKGLSLMIALVLLALPVSGCVQGDTAPEASMVSGRVVLAEDHGTGLAGVSLFIVDGPSSYLETDGEGNFEAAVFEDAVIIPRKTGYYFLPEKQAVEGGQKLEFAAFPGQSLISPGGENSFPSIPTGIGWKHLPFRQMISSSPAADMIGPSGSGGRTMVSR